MSTKFHSLIETSFITLGPGWFTPSHEDMFSRPLRTMYGSLLKRVGCKAGSPSWAPPSSEQFPPPWERCLNGLLFVTFCAVPLKFNKYYVIKKLADIFVLSLLASLIHVLEHYATYSFY